MTLPHFFSRLIELTIATSMDDTFGGHLKQSKKSEVLKCLQHLKEQAEKPQFHQTNREWIRSLWAQAKPVLERYNLFDEFKGQDSLKAELQKMLGI